MDFEAEKGGAILIGEKILEQKWGSDSFKVKWVEIKTSAPFLTLRPVKYVLFHSSFGVAE